MSVFFSFSFLAFQRPSLTTAGLQLDSHLLLCVLLLYALCVQWATGQASGAGHKRQI